MQDKPNSRYPLVSIFCFCKNRVKTIRRCIDSIVAQDYPNVEIIVQDGASTDGTLEILQSYGDKIDLVSEPDSGAGEAMYRALNRVRGDFFGSCLSDEELLPYAASWAAENLTKYPEVAAIYGDFCLIDIDGNIINKKHSPPHWNFEQYLCSETTPPFCSSFFRKCCYESHGLHEYTGGDEFDFWIRLGVRFPIRYVPGLVSKYAIHSQALGSQVNLIISRVESRKNAIERLCNNPETPECTRLLRDKAIASLYPWQAKYYCNVGAWDLAKKVAPDAFRVGPNPKKLHELAELLYRHSTELYQKGQFEQSLEYLDLLIPNKAHDKNFNVQRANILFKLGRIKEAVEASQEELKLQPEHRRAKAIIRLAHSYPEDVHSQNEKLAKELFQTGLKYLSQGISTEAIKYFEEAVKDCEALPELRFAYATALVQLGIFGTAKEACLAELKLQPEHKGVKNLLERIEKAIAENNKIFSMPDTVPYKEDTPAELKFSFIMIVLNGMPFIEYSLKSVYEFAHEIIIVEGAVEKCLFAANKDGSSTDGTVEFIRSFPDPQNKIKLVQGKWPEKCEMQNEALKYVTGNYVWLIDSDEVYKKYDLEKIKALIQANPSITQVNFNGDNFWKGLDYIFVSSKFFETGAHWRRVFKFVKGSRFTTHRPPTMVWPGSNKTTEQMHLVDGHKTRAMGIIPYHYSYVLDKQVKQKIELYIRYNWGDKWSIDLLEWYNECFLKWTPTNRQDIESKYSIWTGDVNSYTLLFEGTHPEAMIEYIIKKSTINRDKSTPNLIMQHVITSVNEIKKRFRNELIIAIETGTIRSFNENHLSTYYISKALGKKGRLISIDISPDSIRRSKNICYQASNIEFVQSDSIQYLNNLEDYKFHFAFLDSVNNKNVIFEEFRNVIPFMIEGGILIVDDAGIRNDGQAIDKSVAAQKGHLVWRFLKTYGIQHSLLNTPYRHGTQLKVVLTRDNLAKIKQNLSRFEIQQETDEISKILPKETKEVKIASDYIKSGIKVGTESSFRTQIQALFSKIRPRKIIETGTYHGTGTTTIIAKSLQMLGINDSMFFTIEVNPQNYARAKRYFETNNIKVNALNGLSVPQTMLPSKEEIARKTITDVDYNGIYVDHKEEDRIELYYNETNFPNLPDNLLYKCLRLFDFKPDFVLLDSGGHMGNIEFNYLINNLQSECYIALDDIYHVKHHHSFKQVQNDPRFEIITASKEKFGFCIVKFTPSPIEHKVIDNRQTIISTNVKKKKVLIIRTDSIGDFVIFSAVLPYYRTLYPNSYISIVVRECSKELAETCPYIDEIIINHRKPMVYDQNYATEFVRRIQAAKYDVAICPIYSRDKISDFITANSGAGEKIVSTGNDSNMSFEQLQANNSYFTKLIPAKAGTMPEIKRNQEFLEGLGVVIDQPLRTTLWIKQEDKDLTDELFKKLNIEKPIVICPFAQHQMRNWPLQKWAQLISQYENYPVLICGTQQDSQMAENIIKASKHPGIHNLCGKTSLRQLAVLLGRSKLCVGVESAPLHIAATVDIPHIVIIGGGHFGRFMPYSTKTTLVYNQMNCYGCNWRCKYRQDIRCIKTITVDMVEQAVVSLLKQSYEPFLQEKQTSHKQTKERKYLVSAIVSTYNSEKFIRGCLEDLENQTIAEKLEIIVVNSGSQQNEEAIVKDFQKRYDNIKYIKTEERETIYRAWNRAIKAASGKYITNANTDDRHRNDALEIMAKTLDESPDKALVYANQLEANEIDNQRVSVGERMNGEFSRARLFAGECPPGSQPMWRRDVHEIFGYFDEDFSVGGDYEFWFRLTQIFDFIYLDEILGERYVGSETVSKSNTTLTNNIENLVIHKSYKYATQEAITIGETGISKHPVFSNWPEVNIWKQNTKAKLQGRQTILHDNIKTKWDFRTNSTPKITVIIVTYNRHEELLENLYALNEQSEKDFEVIVLDNGGDLSWLKQHTDKFKFGLLGIELEYNFGPSPARNIGTEFAKGRYIIFLDDDAVADVTLVRNILNHFENHNISGLRGKVLPKNQTGMEDIPANYDLGDQIITSACEVSCLSAFRKDVLIETGGFDELLFDSEGMELSYRICKIQREKMQSILYFPDVIVFHDFRPIGPARTEKTLRQERMEILAWRKDNNLTGYKVHIQGLYPGNKDIYEKMCQNYSWLINIAIYLSNIFPEEALEWAEKVVALEPERFKGCYILGSLYASFGRYDEALPLLEKIYELLHNSVISANSEFISFEFDDQVDISECYIKTCTQLAQCYIQNNQYERVKRIYTELLNNKNATLTNEQRADILNVIRSLDRTLSLPTTENILPISTRLEDDYLVSAIISTYNSENFFRGCLEDLENQTITDKLEIIVVNSGSQENEEAIVHEYQKKYNNIVYIKTELQEGIYSAWNRAVKVARGSLLTNANTDDRHREDALEIMARTLTANPDIALVYGDQICTDTPNCTFANHHATNIAKRPEYSFERLLFGCCVGSQPMWRKKLHDEFGYFDDTLTCAGDWDFWLRISSKYKFKHIPEFLGTYYHNEDGIEHGRKIHSLYERYIVGKRYGNPYISVIPQYKNINNPLISIITPAYNAAEYIAETIESVLIQNYRNFELIIVDDGSTDNTKDIVTSFTDNKIKYIYKENCGPSSARNLALNKSRGQYIIPLDADDMMTPDFIARHIQEFETHPETDLVYCDDLLIDKSSKPIRVIQRPEYTNTKLLIRDLFHCGFPIIPFRTCFRKSVLDKTGLFDEELLVGEDYDMMRRFIKSGLKTYHLKEALYLRRMTNNSLSKSYSIHKAKCHFEVIKRYAETFTYDELFPEVAWDEIAPQIRHLHAKCLVAGTYLKIGQEYVKSNAPEYSKTAFDRACTELHDCIKMDPENQNLQRLLEKSQLIRSRYAVESRQVALK